MRAFPVVHLLLWLLLFCSLSITAQGQNKKSRVLFLIDGSSSMTYSWNNPYSRYDIATRILLQLVDSLSAVNNEVEFAVRSVGTQYPAQDKNCQDTRLEVPFNLQNVNQIKTRMQFLQPIGFSPIAYSLRMAADNELNNPQIYDYSIIFITDGGESCGGDVCETFKKFLAGRMKVKPYVVGLNKNEQLEDIYRCLGNYVPVDNPSDIDKAIKIIVDANRLLLDKPKQYNLNTTYSNLKPLLPIVTEKPDNTAVRSGVSMQKLPLLPMKLRNKQQLQMMVKTRNWNGKQTVVFTFEPENKPTPVLEPAIQRVTDVFPKLPTYRYWKPKQDKVKLAAQFLRPSRTALTLRFEEDIPRQNVFLNDLPNVMFAFSKSTAINKKANGLKIKQQPVTLRFPFERPPADSLMRLWVKRPDIMASSNKNLKGGASKWRAPSVTLNFPAEKPEPEVWISLKNVRYPMRYSYAFRLPERMKYPQRQAITLRFEQEKPPKRDTVVSKPNKPVQNGDLDFVVETENSEKTQVQVYFKGPNGKAYLNAKPEIEFRELTTNTLKHSFKRLVNQGEPVAQLVDPGNYNVVVTGYTDLYARNVVIQPNKINKVYINVTDGTLTFAYIGNRNRPMEFNAVVNRRFANDPTIIQKCTDRRNYDPGTYYVEITTLPVSKFSIELTFGAVYEIQIPEPGTLKITNTNPVGLIQLQSVLGDGYATFKNLMVQGNLSNQTLILQPGPYKAIVPVNPSVPQLGMKEIQFRVQSNKVTELEIQ